MRLCTRLACIMTTLALMSPAFAQTDVWLNTVDIMDSDLPAYISEIDLSSVSIREMTNAQNCRYGRELFRKGDYAAAFNVFRRILASDCAHPFAQYHLQEIAKKGPQFAYVKAFLNSLPCRPVNFKDEDFLPASMYYEKDKDILLEQVEAYNQRVLDARATLNDKIDHFVAVTAQMDDRISTMQEALTDASEKNDTVIADLQNNLQTARAAVTRMDEEVLTLKHQLATTLIEKSRNNTRPEAKAAATEANTLPIVNTNGSLETARNDLELTGLRAKFADLQTRLNAIEKALKDKNINIQSIKDETRN